MLYLNKATAPLKETGYPSGIALTKMEENKQEWFGVGD